MLFDLYNMEYSTEKSELAVNGTTYDTGLLRRNGYTSDEPQFKVKLNGGYQTLSFKILCSTDRTFKAYTSDETVIQTIYCKAGEAKDVEIPVGGLDYVKVYSAKSWDQYSKTDITIVDLTLQ